MNTPMPGQVCRFAPSCTGRAHPGTLLAGLLAWLDARCQGFPIILRLEDLDPQRCHPDLTQGLCEDFAWFGLDWDQVVRQSTLADQHQAALDRLAAMGRLYPSPMSRRALAQLSGTGPDGAPLYDNRERHLPLTGDWRRAGVPLRVALPPGRFAPVDEGGVDVSMEPATAAGDPVVVRRDGSVAYMLAVVVDDAAAGVTRIVRGRDIAPSTATQAALRSCLGLAEPVYRHHLLVMEQHQEKFSKFHGAVAVPTLQRHYSPRELCGLLAWFADLIPTPEPCSPRDLLQFFSWDRVRSADVHVTWTKGTLQRCQQ